MTTTVRLPPRVEQALATYCVEARRTKSEVIVELLEQRYQVSDNVLVIDGGTSGMEMIEDLSNLDFLIVIDVVKTGAMPGTVVKIAGSEIPVFVRSKLSPHQIALPDVLASLELLDAMPREIVVLGVEPVSLNLSMEMTPTVAAKIPALVALAAAELAARGYALAAATRRVA